MMEESIVERLDRLEDDLADLRNQLNTGDYALGDVIGHVATNREHVRILRDHVLGLTEEEWEDYCEEHWEHRPQDFRE